MSLIYGTGGATVWTPLALGTDLIEWCDTSYAPSLTLVSGKASVLGGRSGHGYHFAQATAGLRPAYSATAWKGKRPGLIFTGTESLVSVDGGFADYPVGTNKPLTIFATVSTTLGTDQFLLQWTNTAATQFLGFWINNDGFMVPDGTAGGAVVTGTHVVSGASRLAYMIGGGSASTYVGNVLDINAAPFNLTINTLDKLLLGCNAVGAAPFIGVVSEFFVARRALTLPELASARSASSSKWG